MDELILIPQFLGSSADENVAPAACGYCTEVACETDAMLCGECSGQSCSGQCATSECAQGCSQGCSQSCSESCSEGCSQSGSGSSPPSNYGDITVTATTSSSISLTLDAISRATSYVVVYRVDGTSDTSQKTTSSRYVTLTGLEPGTTYVINYYGKNSYGTGPYMPSGVTATTDWTAVDPWDWYASNGSATAAQTRKAYDAVTNQGYTSDFSYLVWNDLVDKILETVSAMGHGWDTYYLTYSETLASSGDEITAARMNAVRQNIGRYEATGLPEYTPGDIIYGADFITLTNKLNTLIAGL